MSSAVYDCIVQIVRVAAVIFGEELKALDLKGRFCDTVYSNAGPRAGANQNNALATSSSEDLFLRRREALYHLGFVFQKPNLIPFLKWSPQT